MTVKELIIELMELPMEDTIELAVYEDYHDYSYYTPNHIVNYEDGTAVILGKK